MAISVSTSAKNVAIATGNFSMAINNAIDRSGYWYIYLPTNANNDALLADIKPYKWGNLLSMPNSAASMEIDGTFALITEPWEGANVKYHGGVIEHIGAGTNDITNATEDDAFFFAHLGSLSPATDDNGFYWDRAYIPTGGSNWLYYQYHLHLPTFYPDYENGRLVTSAGNYIKPEDKSFGYCIHSKVKVGNTTYQSVLARVHTPSVGGAHNSHNDVTLPATSNKNYQMGGMIKGSGERFHAFYIAADGAQWSVYSRTYVNASASFTSEVQHGTYDLADATLSPSTSATGGSCYNFPIRASAGDLLGTRIYFPVILNNSTSGFDLEVWSFVSSDSVGAGTLVRQVLLSQQTVRPDCQLLTVGSRLYALCSDISAGGVTLWMYDGTTWEESTNQVVTNNSSKYVRIHGFRYNVENVTFYALLSGTTQGGGSTYTGPGLYSFTLSGTFAGYQHLDYDVANVAFINRNALTSGHLIYTQSDGSIKRLTTTEPQGIASGTNILTYQALKPNFFNRAEIHVGGSEYYYQGIVLKDTRKLLAGRVSHLTYGSGYGDLFLSFISQDNSVQEHFAWGGEESTTEVDTQGDDFITGLYQSTSDPNKVWLCGYTKTELVQKKDMLIHGYCRNLSDSPNTLQHNDIVRDADDNYYLGGTNDEYAYIVKYNANYELQWQKIIGFDTAVTGSSIAKDESDNLYLVGTVDGDALVSKVDKNGNLIWSKTYGAAGTQSGAGIAVVKKSAAQYVVVAVVSGTTTTFLILNTDGTIAEQCTVTDLVVNRVRNQQSTTDGTFLFAGTNGSTAGKFGAGIIDHPTRMIQWTSTFATTATDIANIDAGPTYGYVVVGSSSTSASVLKVTVTESSGTYTVTKSWARTLATSVFNAVAVSPHTETTRYVYAVGYATSGGTAAMGMNEGVIVKYNNSGTIQWQNVFGHDMDEAITGAVLQSNQMNLVTSAWSESHSNGRDALIFRCEAGGYGTGTYHLNGNTGVPYYYLKSTLADASNAGSITNLTAPSDSAGSLTIGAQSLTYAAGGAIDRIFDGSYGANGTFTLFFGYIDLKKVQEYLNSAEYKANKAQGKLVNYTSTIFTFWQISTVGDATADDGNVFGYDIIEASDGKIYIIGQTSGDLTKTNEGASGVYDYILVEFDPSTEDVELYQNGTSADEETYSLTELSNGRIAFTGRTTGTLGANNIGGYDIFLGIYNPANSSFAYFSTGTGLDERGINIHDIGSNTLAIVYSSYGDVGNVVNLGPEDVGIIKFNYVTNTWGNAYQTGTTATDIFDQNGKHSAKLADGRIAIAFSTTGIFDESETAYGALDLALAIIDPSTGDVTKAQIGSQSSDFASSVFADGERLLIAGYISNTFGMEAQGILVETDIQFGVAGKSSA